MRMHNGDEQLSIYDLDTWYGRMFREPSPAEHQKARTSASSSRKSSELRYVMYQSLDLTPGAGNLLGEFCWELHSPWRGDAWTLNTGVSPREEKESSLSQILQDDPPSKSYLTRKACLGILRRAIERGKALPAKLKWALKVQAGLLPFIQDSGPDGPVAYAANQRDEVRDMHNVAGALGAQPGMKQQTFLLEGGMTAGFSAGAGATAGSIGYGEELAPTLKGGTSGNSMPSVLCLNDQGGANMACSIDVTGTLRAQEHGHQPMVYEHHGMDCRCTGPHPVTPAVSAQYGTGGNNTPLVEQGPVYCITGNVADHHAVFSRQRVDMFKNSEIASTQSARQHKDATDLVLQDLNHPKLLRRLTPLECERLQGFPDYWTDIPGASDSARYRALGNSVAIPCVEYLMARIAAALHTQTESR